MHSKACSLKEIARHFGARGSELKKDSAITLTVPNNMEAGKGKQFNERFRAFRKAHAGRLGFTIASTPTMIQRLNLSISHLLFSKAS